MDFQKLLETACGQSNPLSQLIQHVTEDQAFHSNIGNPIALNQYNSMPPQSFRMDDLMREMKQIEPGTNVLQANNHQQPWHNVTAQNYENKTNDFKFQDIVNRCAYPERFLKGTFQEPQQFLEHTNHSNKLQIIPHFEWKSEAPAENLTVFEGGETIKSLDDLEDVEPEQDEEGTDSQEIDDISNSKIERRVPDFDNPRKFLQYVYKYIDERIEREWNLENSNKKFERLTQKDILNPTDYSHIENNPMKNESNLNMKGVQALRKDCFTTSILYFDEALRQNKKSITNWYLLAYALFLKRKNDKAMSVVQQGLRLNPCNAQCIKLMYSIYSLYRCNYQACQSIFNWLKHNKKYSHHIPPHFTMEDKDTTELDKTQLDAVKSIFLETVRENSPNVDSDLQVMIGDLYKLSGDNDKVADCKLAAASSSEIWQHEKVNLGFLIFREGNPYEALDILSEAVENEGQKARIYIGMALIYMYLSNYKEAIQNFKKVLDPKQAGDNSKFEPVENTLLAQHELCLRLFYEYSELR